MMTTDPATADRVRQMIALYGSPDVALHVTRVQLRAIEPYTDRELVAVERALLRLVTDACHP